MAETSITITPRFYETDALGHINNASIAAWLEVSRMSFTGSLLAGTGQDAFSWLVASIHIDFVAETLMGTDVVARISGARAGNTSLTIEHELWQGEQLTVRGTSVLVHVDLQTRSGAPLPQIVRDGLAAAGF